MYNSEKFTALSLKYPEFCKKVKGSIIEEYYKQFDNAMTFLLNNEDLPEPHRFRYDNGSFVVMYDNKKDKYSIDSVRIRIPDTDRFYWFCTDTSISEYFSPSSDGSDDMNMSVPSIVKKLILRLDS